MPNSLLNKITSGIKNSTPVTLNLSSNIVGSSYDETISPCTLLLTNTQVSRLHKALANVSSANIKLSKIQLSKMIQFVGSFSSLIPRALTDIPIVIFDAGMEAFERAALDLTKVATKYFIDKELNTLKKFSSSKGSAIMITNNEVKDIAKSL